MQVFWECNYSKPLFASAFLLVVSLFYFALGGGVFVVFALAGITVWGVEPC